MVKKSNALKIEYKESGVAFSLMICLYIFIVLLGQMILGVLTISTTIKTAINSLFSSFAMAGVILYYTVSRRANIFALTGVKKFNLSSLLLSLLLPVGMLFGVGFINGAVTQFIADAGLNVNTLKLPLKHAGHLILFLFVLAVVPAVVEEAFFRGLMLGALDGAKTITAVIVVSITFAVYHCSLSQLVYQLIYGVTLTMLALYAKSILPGIIAHFINNAAVLLLEYFKIPLNLYNALTILGGILLLVAFTLIIVKGLKKVKTVEKKGHNLRTFFFPFGIFGVAICLIVLVTNLLVVA